MWNITDLEKEKFELKDWNISIKNISVPNYWWEIGADISINDLENNKFTSTWEVRTLLSF